MIYPAQVLSVSIVVVLEIEMIESDTRDYVNIPGKLDLILNVGRGQIGPEMIVCIGRALTERYRGVDGGVGIRRQDGYGTVRRNIRYCGNCRSVGGQLRHQSGACVVFVQLSRDKSGLSG